MFGNNQQLPAVTRDPMVLTVREVFLTIQGEGPKSGTPAVFVRLGGCNLACHFCDTDFEIKDSKMYHIVALADKVEALAGANVKLVVLTGGEPLRQPVHKFVHEINDRGFHVQVETAGMLWPTELAECINLSIVCSPKTPVVHREIAKRCTAWKYVVEEGGVSDFDGLPIMSTQQEGAEARIYRPWEAKQDRTGTRRDYIESGYIFVQPMEAYTRHRVEDESGSGASRPTYRYTRDVEKTARNIALASKIAMTHGYRISLQLHKILQLP